LECFIADFGTSIAKPSRSVATVSLIRYVYSLKVVNKKIKAIWKSQASNFMYIFGKCTDGIKQKNLHIVSLLPNHIKMYRKLTLHTVKKIPTWDTQYTITMPRY